MQLGESAVGAAKLHHRAAPPELSKICPADSTPALDASQENEEQDHCLLIHPAKRSSVRVLCRPHRQLLCRSPDFAPHCKHQSHGADPPETLELELPTDSHGAAP